MENLTCPRTIVFKRLKEESSPRTKTKVWKFHFLKGRRRKEEWVSISKRIKWTTPSFNIQEIFKQVATQGKGSYDEKLKGAKGDLDQGQQGWITNGILLPINRWNTLKNFCYSQIKIWFWSFYTLVLKLVFQNNFQKFFKRENQG